MFASWLFRVRDGGVIPIHRWPSYTEDVRSNKDSRPIQSRLDADLHFRTRSDSSAYSGWSVWCTSWDSLNHLDDNKQSQGFYWRRWRGAHMRWQCGQHLRETNLLSPLDRFAYWAIGSRFHAETTFDHWLRRSLSCSPAVRKVSSKFESDSRRPKGKGTWNLAKNCKSGGQSTHSRNPKRRRQSTIRADRVNVRLFIFCSAEIK